MVTNVDNTVAALHAMASGQAGIAESPRHPRTQARMLPIVRRDRGNIQGRFDSAQTTHENRQHWAMADALAPDAAAFPGIRFILRNRSRYEVANNSYARGIVDTIANDVVGTGPRLHMRSLSAAVNRFVEREFALWMVGTNLSEKLRTARKARCQDGEAFGVMVTNTGLDHPVKLDLREIEAEQVAFLNIAMFTVPAVDGIVLDEHGNPREYHILKVHPGWWSYMSGLVGFPWEFDRIPASRVIHWQRHDRPIQHRAVPELTPALPLFAQLRRYTLAVIAAAETAADFAAVLYTDAPANGEAADVEPMDQIELERRMATVLPGGWKLGQVAAEQPSTTYAEFKLQILCEIGRCLNLPSNVVWGDSSRHNYASGRLDHQTYFRSIRIDRSTCQMVYLDPLFAEWFREAVLIEGYLPQEARMVGFDPAHQWFWDGHEHVDPLKEATAQTTRLASGTTTLEAEYAAQGKDWEVQIRQRAKEIALCRQLGIPAAPPPGAPPGSPQPTDGGEDGKGKTPVGNQPAGQRDEDADPALVPVDEEEDL